MNKPANNAHQLKYNLHKIKLLKTLSFVFLATIITGCVNVADSTYVPADSTYVPADSTYVPADSTYVPSPPVQNTYTPAPSTESSCHPSYSGCLNANVSDYDCSSGSGNGPYYTGTVQVFGPDVFDLDRDNDGWGCE